MFSRMVPVAVALAGGVFGLWMFGRIPDTAEHGADNSVLSISRISPDQSAGEIVDAEIYQPVEFLYELRNVGKAAVRGFKANLACSCQLTREPDAEVAPGASTRLGFVIKPMTFGTTKTTVVISGAGISEPLAVLHADVRVPVTVPMLREGPTTVMLTVLRGCGDAGAIQLQTIERKVADRWITGIESSRTELVSTTAESVHEFPYTDPELCVRTYRFHLAMSEASVGTHQIALTPTVVPGLPTLPPIQAQFRAIERLVFAPASARIVSTSGEKPPTVRVSVVDHRGTGLIEVAKFDHDLLAVRRAKGATARENTFEIEARAIPEKALESRVTFTVDGANERDLIVEIEPVPDTR